tara:strand:+ start:753 stop:1601 length:849 start_codon:yes stop_codon:yes gene_type:complete
MKDNFAVFIMVHGRPNKMWTYDTLRKAGYTGKIYLVADDLDKTVDDYKEKYGDELIVFDKKKAATKMDAGDNTGDLRSTLFSANTIFDLAKERDIKYFFIMCDDYTGFEYRHDEKLMYGGWVVKSLDKVFEYLLEYYQSINAKTIAFAQSGDFMGGKNSALAKQLKMKRKAMNTFLCSTDRPFKFVGRMNEDVTTYVNLGSKGDLFLTVPNISIYQKQTTKEAGGLTDLYLEYGTYIKSFFSVMYNPSSVSVSELGYVNKRLHHRVSWNNAVPKILNEKHKN